MKQEELPAFQKIQYAFTAAIRGIPSAMPLKNIPLERLALYQSLVFNNVDNALSKVFPVLRSLVNDSLWQTLLADFFRQHTAHKPLYRQIAEEFLIYLREHGQYLLEWPFVLELAHYEWLELALLLDDTEFPVTEKSPILDPIAQTIALSPLCYNLGYQFPVHLINSQFIPIALPAEPTFLVMYRNRLDEVKSLLLNNLAARVVELLQTQILTATQVLQLLATELNQPLAALEDTGYALLQQFWDLDIII